MNLQYFTNKTVVSTVIMWSAYQNDTNSANMLASM